MSDSDQKILAGEPAQTTVTSPATATKAPSWDKFAGDGVVFRAKLFGTADVNEARGDNVCNTAINLLKSAVKTTGEHKQKIIMKINYSGITLLDAVNQLKLFEHPINKISFISKDPNDNRAFGYIVTEKEGKHTYFGIRTEKTAEQVVFALRDLFQAAFELKKKESEMKGKSLESPPASVAATTTAEVTNQQQTPHSQAAPVNAAPSMGEEAAKPAIKRDDSASHLLDLIEDLSVAPSTQQPAASSSQSFASQPWPPTQTQASAQWGNAVSPAQNDPFVVQSASQQQPQQQPQQQQSDLMVDQQQKQIQQIQALYNQQPQQQAFQPQFQQAAPQAAFGAQPFAAQPAQPVFNQQPFGAPAMQQQMFAGQPQQPYQQQMFQQQQPPTNSPFAQPQANPSPFAQPQVNPSPFAPNGFQQQNGFQSAPQTQQAPVTNPFASGGNESFGVLQPHSVPQPAPRTSVGQPQQQPNLFSDLNPIPGTTGARKEQFFSDVKNPPKPRMNELASTNQPQGAMNNNDLLF